MWPQTFQESDDGGLLLRRPRAKPQCRCSAQTPHRDESPEMNTIRNHWAASMARLSTFPVVIGFRYVPATIAKDPLPVSFYVRAAGARLPGGGTCATRKSRSCCRALSDKWRTDTETPIVRVDSYSASTPPCSRKNRKWLHGRNPIPPRGPLKCTPSAANVVQSGRVAWSLASVQVC